MSIRAAAIKYGIPPATVTGWVRAGKVRIVQERATRGQAVFVVEPDVALLAKVYKPGRGNKPRKPVIEVLTHAS